MDSFGSHPPPDAATLQTQRVARPRRAPEVPATAPPTTRGPHLGAGRVVRAEATRAAAEAWGGPVTLAPQTLPETGADPFHHVIAGDILSPAMTAPVTQTILDWVASLPD